MKTIHPKKDGCNKPCNDIRRSTKERELQRLCVRHALARAWKKPAPIRSCAGLGRPVADAFAFG
jgi:hypothetical protein